VLLGFEHSCPVPVLRGRVNEKALATLYAAECSNVTGKVCLKGTGKPMGLIEIPLQVAFKYSIEVAAIPMLR
jgi:hypothetical protein